MKFYRKNSERKPQRIIFYRDGVSEGQFKEVSQGNELSMLFNVCLHPLCVSSLGYFK